MTEEEGRQTVRITNIQRFCLHDGPGIRTTVFLKGCSIHCPWCCNPENIRYEIQTWKDEKDNEGTFGYDISLEDLKNEILKDKVYFLNGGGITFSGGEPLLQIKRYEPLLRELKAMNFHLAVETALFVEAEQVEIGLKYFDFWYVDMKTLVPETCDGILGGQVNQYLNNLASVAKGRSKVCIRIPCYPGITDADENIMEVSNVLRSMDLNEVQLFQIHNMSEKKYMSLGLMPPKLKHDSKATLKRMRSELTRSGMQCTIIHL